MVTQTEKLPYLRQCLPLALEHHEHKEHLIISLKHLGPERAHLSMLCQV